MQKSWLAAVAVLLLFVPRVGEPQVERLVLGSGQHNWTDLAELMAGMHEIDGGLQPYELDPAVNILRGEKVGNSLADIFGNRWRGWAGGPANALLLPGRPEIFAASGNLAIDGDTTRTVAIVSGWFYFNLGWPLPVNRVRFFPPDEGRTQTDDRRRIQAGLPLREAYPKSYALHATNDGQGFKNNKLEILLAENPNHRSRVADVRFPTQSLQFLHLGFPELGVIAEIQVFGEGFVQTSRYISQVIDMGEPVTFGQVVPYFRGFSKETVEAEPRLLPDPPIRWTFEAQTGSDETPWKYSIYTELMTERTVSFESWEKAPQGGRGPGTRGPQREDVDNWSFWSSPRQVSGGQHGEILSPDSRRYIKLRFDLTSEDLFTYGRVDSLAIEFSPLLADVVVGEVALEDEPQPLQRRTQVPLGEEQVFTYDVRAEFVSAAKGGFDAIRLRTPARVEFLRFEMGEPLTAVVPDSVSVGDGEMVVYFPANRVYADDNRPLRLVFRTGVFNFNALFLGEVFSVGEPILPQSVNAGDANPAVSTNSIEVLAPFDKLEVLGALEVATPVLTPNGDGNNDTVEMAYSLLGVQFSHVNFEIYDLSGRKIRTLVAENRREGRFVEEWDGMGDGTGLVPPGIYLARLAVHTDAGTFTRIRSIGVVY